MNINIMKVRENAKLPTYGTDGAGAFDLYAAETIEVKGHGNKIHLGIAVEVPEGYVMLIMPRSSMGTKTKLRMSNSIGVIDSDYRGEICAVYDNDEDVLSWAPSYVVEGARVAQGFVIPVPRVEFTEVDQLSKTARGTGGFGSTGK